MRPRKKTAEISPVLLKEIWYDHDYSLQETAHLLGVSITTLDQLVAQHKLRKPKPYWRPRRRRRKDPTPEEIAQRAQAIRAKNLAARRASTNKVWAEISTAAVYSYKTGADGHVYIEKQG